MTHANEACIHVSEVGYLICKPDVYEPRPPEGSPGMFPKPTNSLFSRRERQKEWEGGF